MTPETVVTDAKHGAMALAETFLGGKIFVSEDRRPVVEWSVELGARNRFQHVGLQCVAAMCL